MKNDSARLYLVKLNCFVTTVYSRIYSNRSKNYFSIFKLFYYLGLHLRKVSQITVNDYRPVGSTALYDSIRVVVNNAHIPQQTRRKSHCCHYD